MEKHTITSKWAGNLAFEGVVRGHKIMLDTAKEAGGDDRGASPKQLMLLALAGCTGTDILVILKKMKIQIEDLKITVEGTQTDEHPKYYHSMHIIYEFRGKDLPADQLHKAIEMSQDKYCGVLAVYKKASMNISSEIRIIRSESRAD